MSNTTRTTITLTLSFDMPASPERPPILVLDDLLVAADRGMRRCASDAACHITRLRLDADIDEAKTTTL